MQKKSSGTALSLVILTVFASLLYLEIFYYNTFGPEFPLFYFYSDALSVAQVLRSYTYLFLPWYRPTSTSVFYWLGGHFFAWHDVAGWKLFNFCTFLVTCYALYWVVSRRLVAGRLAAFLAVLYFIAQPSLYAVVMEVSPFDFIHILLALLCAGLYLQALEARAGRSILATAFSWILFVIALTAKEMTLAVPIFLFFASTLFLAFDTSGEPWRKRWPREAVRLAPFFALLPVYYLVHLSKIPPDSFAGTGPYRDSAQWTAILANLRRFPLWIVRIYGFTGDALNPKMYQSTLVNNTVGILSLVLVVLQWIRKVRENPARWRPLLLMLSWMGAFLALPLYAGGFLWHINLPLVGYCVLFGMAIAWWLEELPSPIWRRVVLGGLLVGALVLGRANLHAELYQGMHASAFRINHSVVQHPPIPAAQLGKSPLIYVEDRLGLGPWWYGCFGRLFNFVYLRHDIEEVIVPPLDSFPEDLRKRWLARPNAFFVRYDEHFDWHDATAEFRDRNLGHDLLQPAGACVVSGQHVQFSLVHPAPGTLHWAIDPADAGSISASGLYQAPRVIPESRTVRISATQPGYPAMYAGTTLTLGGRAPIRVAAGSSGFTDTAGRVWKADQNYRGGKTYTTTHAITGTDTPQLYQNERFEAGPFRYLFCVANGTYQVTFKFAEVWFTEPGQRVFDVALNGVPVLQHFDPLAQAGGPNRALDRQFPVFVKDGRIVIEFRPVTSNPKISAIEIVPQSLRP